MFVEVGIEHSDVFRIVFSEVFMYQVCNIFANLALALSRTRFDLLDEKKCLVDSIDQYWFVS